MSLTRKAHQWLLEDTSSPAERHMPFGYSIDATCGNGHDTVFLAEHTKHQVFSFDVQQQAIKSAQCKLKQNDLATKVTLLLNGHETIQATLAKLQLEKARPLTIDAIMFNLGYLPQGDASITTKASTTLQALQQACSLLSNNGKLTMLCYRGHPGGLEESQLVDQWLLQQAPQYNCHYQRCNGKVSGDTSPILFMVQKLTSATP